MESREVKKRHWTMAKVNVLELSKVQGPKSVEYGIGSAECGMLKICV
jgi:hypothetical protein